VEGLKGWRVEGLKGWRVEGLKGWRVEGLRGWRVEGLKGWRVEGLKGWRVYLSSGGFDETFTNFWNLCSKQLLNLFNYIQTILAMHKFGLLCVCICNTQTLFKYKVRVSPRLAHTHTCRQHSHHTQRENKSTERGGGKAAAPNGTFVRARAARAPVCVCGVKIGGTCVCASHLLAHTL